MNSSSSTDSVKSASVYFWSSSGSSGPSSNPSASSSSDVNSMATEPTQEAVDGPIDEEEDCDKEEAEEHEVWGRLFSLQGRFFSSVDLKKNEYLFGRDNNSDFIFKAKDFVGKDEFFRSISKTHFKITREGIGNDQEVFLTDLSANGTFVNGTKIGKYNRHYLRNNDEIAFPVKNNKAFFFNDVKQAEKENEKYPENLTRKYSIGKILGSGACGEVRLCFKKPHMERFAVKIVSKKKFSVTSVIKSEVDIVRSLNHPCIVSVEDVEESDDHLFIILELVSGGELFDRVIKVKRIEEKTTKLLFYQMLLAVEYLHNKGITHRDLKPENVLLATDETDTLIKITDFGLCRFVPDNTMMKTLCGTLNYLAPEVNGNMGMSGYGKKCDCWSLGCILFVCLGGYPPFNDEDPNKSRTEQVKNGDFLFPSSIWGHITEEAKNLIRQLLIVDPAKRLSVNEALQHPWLQDEEMKQRVDHLLAHGGKRLQSQISATGDSNTSSPSELSRKRSQDSTFDKETDLDPMKKPRIETEP